VSGAALLYLTRTTTLSEMERCGFASEGSFSSQLSVQLLFVIDSATGYAEVLYKFICDLHVARKGCKGLTRSHRPFSCPQNKHADRQSDRSTPRRACMHDVIVSPRHSQKHSYSDSNVQLLNPDCAETVNTRTLDWPDSSDYAHLILKTEC